MTHGLLRVIIGGALVLLAAVFTSEQALRSRPVQAVSVQAPAPLLEQVEGLEREPIPLNIKARSKAKLAVELRGFDRTLRWALHVASARLKS